MTPLLDLVLVAILIALAVSGSVIFYHSLSERDALSGRVRRTVDERSWSPRTRLIVELVAGLVAAPLLVVVWITVIDIALFFILPLERVIEIVLLPYTIVAASRLLAYLHPVAAHELAKTLPLALVVLLLVGQPLGADSMLAKAALLDEQLADDPILLLGVVALELVLRLGWILRRHRAASVIAAGLVPTPPESRC